MKPLVKAWSLSALQLYEKCPASYKAAKIDKMKTDSKSYAMERGIAIHAKGEQFLLGNIPNVPKEYKCFAKELKNLKRKKAQAERKVGITKDWEFTGFFDHNVWLRFVTDADLDLDDKSKFFVDFKTGRIYKTNEDQSNLYSTCFLSNGYNESFAEFWYLDQEEIKSFEYEQRQAHVFREYWEDKVAPLFAETKWRTNPSNSNCRYCVKKKVCPDAC